MPRSVNVSPLHIGTVKRACRQQGFLSQRALAEDLGIALSTVSKFLNGGRVDRAIFEEICEALGLDWRTIAAPIENEDADLDAPSLQVEGDPERASSQTYQDWGDAPNVTNFFGREVELACLEQWVVSDRCRLITILGMGGAGKTASSIKLAEQICDVEADLNTIVWRSLRNAPPLQILLSDLILTLSRQRVVLPERIEEQITWLIEFFHEHRCVLVLDNVESILQSGDRVGQYCEGYEGYDELFCRIADGRHQSCLVLTSRERPRSLYMREGPSDPVRSLQLGGLPVVDGERILRAKGLVGPDRQLQDLVERYGGNPLALRIVAATVQSTLAGDVQAFLHSGISAYGDVWELLDQQCDRLSLLEKQVMLWLAIEREWMTLDELHASWIPALPKRDLLEALDSLQGRSLIEAAPQGFTQQPVVMEYVIEALISQCHDEITAQSLSLLRSHALLRPQAPDYIRETQIHLILQPLIQKLFVTLADAGTIDFLLSQLLNLIRGKPLSYTGYAAGNIINLLSILRERELSDRNFSDLAIARAYLTETTLHRTTLSGSTLHQSTFIEPIGGIVAIAYSTDSQRIAASDARGDIHVWQTSCHQKVATLRGHHSWVFSLVFSPSGATLASASDDYVVKLWDLDTENCLQTLRGPANILNAVTFSSDERQIITQSETIQLWNAEHPEQQISAWHGHTFLARSIAFSPDGTTIASSTQQQTIALWNRQTGDCKVVLKAASPGVRLVAFSPDGRLLASTSLNPNIQIWDLSTEQCIHLLDGHTQGISEIAFSPDSRLLASASFDQTVKLWEIATGRCLKTLSGHRENLMAVAFSPDGQQLATGGHDQVLKLWNVQMGQCINTFQGYTNSVPAIALSPNHRLLASAHDDMTVKVWDLENQHIIGALPAHKDLVWAVAFSPDGDRLVSTSADRTIRIWNWQTSTYVNGLGHGNWVWSVSFHPNGHLFATGSYDQTIKLWNPETGECLRTLSGHASAVLCVCFNSDGRLLASSSFDQTVRLWDTETWTCIVILQGHSGRIWQVAHSPDNQYLASCSHDQTVKLWGTGGACIHTLHGHQGAVTSVCFSPDNHHLVSGGFDTTIKIWDVRTGQCLRTLEGHTSGVLSLLYCPADLLKEVGCESGHSLIISSSIDGTIKFWQPETGNCLRTLRAPRPYEDMDITSISGLTEAQQATLKTLGAIAHSEI